MAVYRSLADVSDDLRTVTWKHTDTDDPELTAFNLTLALFRRCSDRIRVIITGLTGFRVEVITGLRADASGVGHGGDITAEVKVNGSTVGAGPMKAASVANGLDPVVKAAKAGSATTPMASWPRSRSRKATRTRSCRMDSFLITFRNIPEGVTVMVPEKVGLVDDDQPGTNANENDESFILKLVEGRAGDGVGKPEGGMAPVELSATGTGEVRYKIGMTAADEAA